MNKEAVSLLDRLEAANKERNQGEWVLETSSWADSITQLVFEDMSYVMAPRKNYQNAHFIALAANSMDKLLAVVRAAVSAVETASGGDRTCVEIDMDEYNKLKDAVEALK